MSLRIALVYPHIEETTGVPRLHVMLARYLVGRGHQVHLIGDPASGDAGVIEGATFHPVRIDPMTPTRLGRPRYQVRFARASSALVARMSDSLDVVHVRAEYCLRPDVYHVTGVQWGERRRMPREENPGFVRRLKDIAYPIAYPLHPTVALLERRMLRAPSLVRVHAESQVVADDLTAHYGIPSERIEVIQPPVDPTEFHPSADPTTPRELLSFAAQDPVLVFVGDDFHRKGLDRVIDALALMAEPAHLAVVGTGTHAGRGGGADATEGLRRRAQEAGVGSRVHFLGHRSDIPELLREADVFVLPSRSDMWAMAIVEAMASGLPPVVSSGAGASSILTDGLDGHVLDEPVDVRELARRLDGLCGSPETRRRMGEKAAETAKRFSIDTVYGRVERTLAEVAALKRSTE